MLFWFSTRAKLAEIILENQATKILFFNPHSSNELIARSYYCVFSIILRLNSFKSYSYLNNLCHNTNRQLSSSTIYRNLIFLNLKIEISVSHRIECADYHRFLLKYCNLLPSKEIALLCVTIDVFWQYFKNLGELRFSNQF